MNDTNLSAVKGFNIVRRFIADSFSIRSGTRSFYVARCSLTARAKTYCRAKTVIYIVQLKVGRNIYLGEKWRRPVIEAPSSNYIRTCCALICSVFSIWRVRTIKWSHHNLSLADRPLGISSPPAQTHLMAAPHHFQRPAARCSCFR